MTYGKNKQGAGESHESGQESAAGGGEQNGHGAQRQKSDGHEAQRPAALAVHQEGGKRKAEIEKTGHFVGVLAVGGKADLAGGDGVWRAEGEDGEHSENARAGHSGAQQVAQIRRRIRELPHQPDDHHLLKVGTELFQGDYGIDSPETGAAKPEIQGQGDAAECIPRAHAAGLKDGRNRREQNEQAGDAGHIAQRLAEIEGVLPRNGEGQDEEQDPCSSSHRLIPL